MNIQDWSPSTAYTAGAIVVHGNDMWQANQASTNSPPGLNNSDWRVIVGDNDAVTATRFITKLFLGAESAVKFGAIADGVTDNSAVITRAVAAGVTSLYFPAGTYYFSTTPGSESGINPTGLRRIFGDGIGQTILQYNEGTTGSPSRLFYRSANNPGYTGTHRDSLIFEDIEFRGTYTDSDATYRGGTCIHLDAYDEIRFHRCAWRNCASFATDLHWCNRVVFDHCLWDNIGRDQARGRDCFYMRVTNCFFSRGGDDAVAWHTVQYSVGYNPDDGSPRRQGLFVHNNYFADTSVGVSALGPRFASICDNMIVRGRGAGIYITNVATEGTFAPHQIRIMNNTITDRADASSNPAIYVSAADPRATVASSSVIPGYPASGTGAFQFPWDYLNSDGSDAADALPPISDIIVSGNIIGRTLPTVTNYSDWGYGVGGKLDSHPYNPAITNAGLRWSAGISIKGGMRVLIDRNIVSHTTDAIVLIPPASLNPSSWAAQISHNTVFDCIGRLVQINGATSRRTDFIVHGNQLNGDFYRQAGNSNTDGTYDSGNTTPTAIDVGGNSGGRVEDNVIQNVARVHAGSDFTTNKWNNNTCICDPVALGASASNKGIGNVPNPAEDFKFIIADCDPTSATFGQLKNVCIERSNVMPTSGTYLQNQVVKNGNVTLAGGKTTAGWVRLTTGTGHVSGTDWTALVIPNS